MLTLGHYSIPYPSRPQSHCGFTTSRVNYPSSRPASACAGRCSHRAVVPYIIPPTYSQRELTTKAFTNPSRASTQGPQLYASYVQKNRNSIYATLRREGSLNSGVRPEYSLDAAQTRNTGYRHTMCGEYDNRSRAVDPRTLRRPGMLETAA